MYSQCKVEVFVLSLRKMLFFIVLLIMEEAQNILNTLLYVV